MSTFYINTIAATTNPDVPHPFTEEKLKLLAETVDNTPVALNFDAQGIIGNVYHAEVINGRMHVKMNVKLDCAYDYISIGFTAEPLKIVCFGIIPIPPEDDSYGPITGDEITLA